MSAARPSGSASARSSCWSSRLPRHPLARLRLRAGVRARAARGAAAHARRHRAGGRDRAARSPRAVRAPLGGDGTGAGEAAGAAEIEAISLRRCRARRRASSSSTDRPTSSRASARCSVPRRPKPRSRKGAARVAGWFERYVVHPLYALLLRAADRGLQRRLPRRRPRRSRGRSTGALAGILTVDRRTSRDGRVGIVSAAHPVWAGDSVQGAVVVEETTNAVLAQRNRAFERLFTLVLALTLAGATGAHRLRDAAVLRASAGCATRSSRRSTRRGGCAASPRDRRPATRSATCRGASPACWARLADSVPHREALASRLSHELRTPIAVVRSSLDNLQGTPCRRARVYVERAQGGLDRLAQILTRMSEATRLEQSIDRPSSSGSTWRAGARLRRGLPQRLRAARVHRRWRRRGDRDLAARRISSRRCSTSSVANAVEFGVAGAADRGARRACRGTSAVCR